MGRFRFGPLGRLMVIDSPRDGFDTETSEVGALHESLSGARTKDVFGYKAKYKIGIEGLEPRALSWFEMAFRGALGSVLYFVDEQRINRLSAEASSGLSVLSGVDPFTHISGTHVKAANTALLLPGPLDGVAAQTPGPAGAVSWTNVGTQNLLRCGPMVPVQPGEHVVFSVYILSGTPTLEFTPYDAAGAALPQAGSVTTTVAGPPERRYASYTVPGTGVAAVQPCVRHALAQTSVITGLQFEQGDTPTPWTLGAGSPLVLVDEFPTKRRWLGSYVDASITLLEV